MSCCEPRRIVVRGGCCDAREAVRRMAQGCWSTGDRSRKDARQSHHFTVSCLTAHASERDSNATAPTASAADRQGGDDYNRSMEACTLVRFTRLSTKEGIETAQRVGRNLRASSSSRAAQALAASRELFHCTDGSSPRRPAPRFREKRTANRIPFQRCCVAWALRWSSRNERFLIYT